MVKATEPGPGKPGRKPKEQAPDDSFEDVEDEDEEEQEAEQDQQPNRKKQTRKNSTASTTSTGTSVKTEQLTKEELQQKKIAERKLNQAYKRLLKRQCFVCKLKMHQDLLNDHYVGHFVESPKCSACDKHSTNPSNYVTHILSHLRKLFATYSKKIGFVTVPYQRQRLITDSCFH